MNRDEIKQIFDQQAASYDDQWARTAPIANALHFLLGSVFAGLPGDAHVLCVGAGTGAELVHLAKRFPRWCFTVVEPASAMLAVCRRKAAAAGFFERCTFHEGYVDSLSSATKHDAATCFLVSQFLLDPAARSQLFQAIADRLAPGGILASSDLTGDITSNAYQELFNVWFDMMAATGVSPEARERMQAAYGRDVAVLPAETIAGLIEAGGFRTPVQFYQAGLISAWFSVRK